MAGGVKHDSNKIRMELIPPSLLQAVGRVLTFGARKYTDRNWEKGIEWSRCYGAALRHLTSWWDGENSDQETELSHLDHALACLCFLRHYEVTHPELDDRPDRPQPPEAQ